MRSYFISAAQNIKPEPGLHPELYFQCAGNRVLTGEVPSLHTPAPHALLEAKMNLKHKLLRER